MSQFAKPSGFFGRFLARGMAWGHRDFYKNAAKVLDLHKSDSFLEIGFGSGLFIKKYASDAFMIRGLDCSEDMVGLAGDINKGLVRSERAEFVLGDVSSMPWEDGTFSAVAAIETFFFWKDPKTALEEIYRVMRPDGRLIIEMGYNKDDGQDHTSHVKKFGIRLYSGDEMKKMLSGAGFVDVNITYYKGAWMPIKGHLVNMGMIVKAIKPLD